MSGAISPLPNTPTDVRISDVLMEYSIAYVGSTAYKAFV
jgi:hypothetical protein